VLVLLAHGLLVLAFLLMPKSSRIESAQQLVYLSLWPEMRPAPEESAQPPPKQSLPKATRPRKPLQVAPVAPTSITPSPESTTAPSESIRPNIDWRAEAAAVAGRHAIPPPPAEFSPPPKVMRKACEKKKSSWEWNPQPKKAALAPLPYVVLGRCVIGLGFFGCSPGKPPEANSHLLDDMRAGKTEASSVPDPDTCD
jgi:hypothetical protein